LLEIGALTPDNYASCAKWIENEPIDLHSQHPSIKEQDFFERPIISDKLLDLISCSLVLNFVPDPRQRGESSQSKKSHRAEPRLDAGPNPPSTQTFYRIAVLSGFTFALREELAILGLRVFARIDEGSRIQSGQGTMEARRQSGILAMVSGRENGQARRAMEAEGADASRLEDEQFRHSSTLTIRHHSYQYRTSCCM
jgi:25S rRNA (adenine2142-N1)-methyltransferase